MGPLRTCAWIGILVIPIACKTAGGSRVSRPDDDEFAPRRAPEAGPEPVSLAQVEPEFLAALETVQAAVQAGDDATARAILDRVFWRGPEGKTLAVARAFERVLDGRAALRELELVLESVPETEVEPQTDGSTPLPAVSQTNGAHPSERPALRGLWLVARNEGLVPLVLAPGPATLVTTHQRLDVRAALASTSEAHSFESLKPLSVAPGGEARVRLSAFFLEAAPDALAERLAFHLELRAGAIRRDGRELPAQRVVVRDLEACVLSEPLTARGPATADELEALLRGGRVETAPALELALRLAPEEREAALDAIAKHSRSLAETDMKELVPALRWLSRSADPGGDPVLWRALLERRALGTGARHGNLVLPPARVPGP